MNTFKNLWRKLSGSKKYREEFVGAFLKRAIPLQIRILRKQHNWSQERLALQSSLTQGVISRAEDPNYGNLTFNTVIRIAAGFDCAFVGKFVPFSELAHFSEELSEDVLFVPSFSDEMATWGSLSMSDASKQPARQSGAMNLANEQAAGGMPPSRVVAA